MDNLAAGILWAWLPARRRVHRVQRPSEGVTGRDAQYDSAPSPKEIRLLLRIHRTGQRHRVCHMRGKVPLRVVIQAHALNVVAIGIRFRAAAGEDAAAIPIAKVAVDRGPRDHATDVNRLHLYGIRQTYGFVLFGRHRKTAHEAIWGKFQRFDRCVQGQRFRQRSADRGLVALQLPA